MTDVVSAGEFLRFALALIFVIGLISLLAFLFRRYGTGLTFTGRPGALRRLSVQEVLPLDARHRLFLVRRDSKEHLLLLGPQGSIVVESNIDAEGSFASIGLQEQGTPPGESKTASRFQHLLAGIAQRRNGKNEEEPDKG